MRSVLWYSFVGVNLLLCTAFFEYAAAQRPAHCEGRTFADQIEGFVNLPYGDVFCGLLADPKEPRSFISILRGTTAPFDTDIGAVGIGEYFGLMRYNALQLSITGSIFAQFDLRTPSYDLINADYIIGLPLTYRYQGFSLRLLAYHQSSHLGDEYLLRDPAESPERENLSFEAITLTLSQEIGLLRLYAGGEHLFNREPPTLEQNVVQAGAEMKLGAPLLRVWQFGSLRLVAGADLKTTEEQDWKPAWSLRGGVEIGPARETTIPTRRGRIMAEYYRGPTPYGQFFREQILYYGIGVHLTRF